MEAARSGLEELIASVEWEQLRSRGESQDARSRTVNIYEDEAELYETLTAIFDINELNNLPQAEHGLNGINIQVFPAPPSQGKRGMQVTFQTT